MRRFVCTGLLLLGSAFLTVGAWFYEIKPALEGNTNFLVASAKTKTVTVPLGGTEYVDIQIDGINTELEQGNQSTVWQFNDNRIVRTMRHLDGKSLGDGLMYMSNREVYKKFGDYYISVASDNRNIKTAAESLRKATSYQANCPVLDDNNRIESLLSVALPTDYEVEGEWKLPHDVEEVIMSNSSDDKSYCKGSWYFNYNFRYQKNEDAVKDAATRVCALSKEGLDWWYSKDNVFVCKAGNEVACVVQRNYTSCYFVSSNDLSYIMLNL